MEGLKKLGLHGDVHPDAYGEVSVSKSDFNGGRIWLASKFFDEDCRKLNVAGYQYAIVIQPEIGCPEYEIVIRGRR